MNQTIRKTEAAPGMGGAGNLELLYHLCEYVAAEKIIETGVACGWSSLAILFSLKNRAHSKLISIDIPYIQQDYAKFVGIVIPEKLKTRWILKSGSDRMKLESSISEIGCIDLCHYDSDKNYAGRMWAYPRLWNALRRGGMFISDDIGDNMGFADFCKQKKIDPVVIELSLDGETKSIGAAVKQVNSYNPS